MLSQAVVFRTLSNFTWFFVVVGSWPALVIGLSQEGTPVAERFARRAGVALTAAVSRSPG